VQKQTAISNTVFNIPRKENRTEIGPQPKIYSTKTNLGKSGQRFFEKIALQTLISLHDALFARPMTIITARDRGFAEDARSVPDRGLILS